MNHENASQTQGVIDWAVILKCAKCAFFKKTFAENSLV